MPKYDADFLQNPKFNTVLGLTNTTFDANNIVSGRMVTEQQLQDTWRRIYDDEILIDRCCRDIILWETYVQVVRLNNNTFIEPPNLVAPCPGSGGTVVSSFYDNVKVGISRRGLPLTAEFALKWDSNLYSTWTPEARQGYNGNVLYFSQENSAMGKYVHYRFLYDTDDNQIGNDNAMQGTSTNRANFFSGKNQFDGPENGRGGVVSAGRMVNTINSEGVITWYSFILNIANDGTVTLRDNRRRTDFNIIRFFTQWCLKRCSDGSILPEPTFG